MRRNHHKSSPHIYIYIYYIYIIFWFLLQGLSKTSTEFFQSPTLSYTHVWVGSFQCHWIDLRGPAKDHQKTMLVAAFSNIFFAKAIPDSCGLCDHDGELFHHPEIPDPRGGGMSRILLSPWLMISLVGRNLFNDWLVVSNIFFFHFIYGIILPIDKFIFCKMVKTC